MHNPMFNRNFTTVSAVHHQENQGPSPTGLQANQAAETNAVTKAAQTERLSWEDTQPLQHPRQHCVYALVFLCIVLGCSLLAGTGLQWNDIPRIQNHLLCQGFEGRDRGRLKSSAASSCFQIHKMCPTFPSGKYWVDPHSIGNPFQVECDMKTDGGGWYVFYAKNIYNLPDEHWDGIIMAETELDMWSCKHSHNITSLTSSRPFKFYGSTRGVETRGLWPINNVSQALVEKWLPLVFESPVGNTLQREHIKALSDQLQNGGQLAASSSLLATKNGFDAQTMIDTGGREAGVDLTMRNVYGDEMTLTPGFGGSCTPKSTEHQPALYTWHTLAQKCKTKSAWGNIQCEFDRSRCLDTKLDSKFILPTAFRSKFHKTGGGLSFGWVTTNKDQNNTERRFLFRPESASYLSEKFIAPFSVLPVVVSQVQFMSGYAKIRTIVKQNRIPDGTPVEPYIAMLINCMINMIYGTLIQDLTVLSANFPGLLLSIYYVFVFYRVKNASAQHQHSDDDTSQYHVGMLVRINHRNQLWRIQNIIGHKIHLQIACGELQLSTDAHNVSSVSETGGDQSVEVQHHTSEEVVAHIVSTDNVIQEIITEDGKVNTAEFNEIMSQKLGTVQGDYPRCMRSDSTSYISARELMEALAFITRDRDGLPSQHLQELQNKEARTSGSLSRSSRSTTQSLILSPQCHQYSGLIISLCLCNGVVIITLLVFPHQQRIHIFGTLMALCAAYMIASPLVSLPHVIRTKSTGSMSLFQSVCGFTSSMLWTLYGWAIMQDPYIWVHNSVGIICSLFQLLLFVKYRKPAAVSANTTISDGGSCSIREINCIVMTEFTSHDKRESSHASIYDSY